ncbi:hypothetical protein P4377_28785 [Bacillus thuringiensis]|nr:hypothetical protein [Bacillus thuringiensis]
MLKKLIAGALITGITLGGGSGIVAKAATPDFDRRTEPVVALDNMNAMPIIKGVTNLYLDAGKSEWVTPPFYLQNKEKVDFHGWQQAAINGAQANVRYQLIDTETGQSVSNIDMYGDFKTNASWFHASFILSNVKVPKCYRIKAINHSTSGVNVGGNLYIK